MEKIVYVLLSRFLEVIHLSKINPGSNRNEDNDLTTATPGMQNVDIPEPKQLEKNKLQCPACERTFNSKEDYISHALARHQLSREPNMEESASVVSGKSLLQSKELSSVQYEMGFHFFTDLGKYTGVTATSLDEFTQDLKNIPQESVTFHFQRQDYQKWVKDVFGDDELAKKIDNIKQTSENSADNLRKELSQTVQETMNELRNSERKP